MQLPPTKPEFIFLKGGGEMGQLIRSYNWAQTSLGAHDTWPPSLRTTLNILLNSKFPMLLFWGDDLICFYNDAYRASFGNEGKPPLVLGKPGARVWAETWPVTKPLIDQVLASGEATWSEDLLIPTYRNGRLEDAYWTFSCSPVYSDEGQINGSLVTFIETVEKASRTNHAFVTSEPKFRQLTDTVPAIVWETRPDGYCTYLNRQWYDLTGQTPAEAEGFGWLDATHPDDKAECGRLFLEANQNQTSFSAVYRLRYKDGSYRWAIDRGSPRFEADGTYEGMIGTVVDIHDQKVAEESLRASEQRFQAAVEAVQGVLWTNDALGQMEGAQPGWASLTGQSYEEYRGYGWAQAVHPDDAQPTVEAWNAAVREKRMFNFKHRLRMSNGMWGQFSIKAIPLLDPTGSVREWVGVHTNITDQHKAEEALRASEFLFRNVTNSSPTGLWLSDETGGLTYLNNTLVEWTGLPYESLLGAGWANAIIDEDRQRSADAFLSAIAARAHYDVQFRINKRDGSICWCHAAGDPYYNEDGRYAGYAGFCMDIHELVKQRLAIEASEAKFRSLIEEAPIATCLFVGREMRIEIANDSIVANWAQGRPVLGKPLIEALPEFANQPFLTLLDRIYTTGKMYEEKASRVDLVRDGAVHTHYYDFMFKPLLKAAGDVYAVLVMAVDVTEQVLVRQKIEETEAALRGAIEMAELGTWQIDLATRTLHYSERLREWFGIGMDEIITPERAYRPVRAEDEQRVRAAITHAITPGTDGIYDIEYSLDPTEAGRERILHVQGQAFVDEKGEPYKLIGTAKDVTEQRRVQQELERQVEERTQQLQASVRDLQRSNQNLQQFAYVASHDLQEPLRKIQSFGDMITNQYGEQLGEGKDYLVRMQASASRMSLLIKDLLTFSRISTQQDTSSPVSLTSVITTALLDLDLSIQETKAHVDVGTLPTVQGDQSQLGQLFQNLISNALKFSKKEETPRITINCEVVTVTKLPPTIRPTRQAPSYYRIDVSDNGIGFDEKYLDRIFQVFQRLHGKSQYAGTGIGLAICEKVAANHGGAITASGKPGYGATFSVYLPA